MTDAPRHRYISKPQRERPVPMSNVFFSVSVSLDGYLAPPGMDLEHAFDATYEAWGAQWGKLQSWVLPTRLPGDVEVRRGRRERHGRSERHPAVPQRRPRRRILARDLAGD